MRVSARRIRTRGGVAIMLVLAMSLVIGVMVLSSGSLLMPAWSEARRTRSSDAALALAEAGIALARGNLAHDPAYGGVSDLRLGGGTVSVDVTRTGDEIVVRSRATLRKTARTPHAVTRRVEARLRLVPGKLPTVVAWQER